MKDFSPNDPHLSTLEQISPQAYVRFILCFKLQPGTLQNETTQILSDGLKATAATVPALKSLVVPVFDSSGRETKDLRRDDVAMFTAKDLTNSRLDYDDIKSQGFPNEIFVGELLCPTGLFAVPGCPVPAFQAQANLIPGGLLLGLSFWHMAFDGIAITTVLRLWAHNCRVIQDPENNILDVSTLSSETFDKSRLSAVSSAQGVSINDHPEFILLPKTPTASPPPASTPPLTTQIFYFSPASISALKDLTSPKNTSSPSTKYSWISTNTAISALTWRSIMAARFAHQHPISDSQSVFCTAINARTRMIPPLSPDLLASAFCFHDCRLPINTLLSANLADIAYMIRDGAEKMDDKYIDSLISMIDGVSTPSLLLPVAFLDLLKTSMMMTNWSGFGMYDFDWGDGLGGKCERVRTASIGMFNGLQVVLPVLTGEMGGGLEVVVGLEDEAMERLKGDEVWMRFARLG